MFRKQTECPDREIMGCSSASFIDRRSSLLFPFPCSSDLLQPTLGSDSHCTDIMSTHLWTQIHIAHTSCLPTWRFGFTTAQTSCLFTCGLRFALHRHYFAHLQIWTHNCTDIMTYQVQSRKSPRCKFSQFISLTEQMKYSQSNVCRGQTLNPP